MTKMIRFNARRWIAAIRAEGHTLWTSFCQHTGTDGIGIMYAEPHIHPETKLWNQQYAGRDGGKRRRRAIIRVLKEDQAYREEIDALRAIIGRGDRHENA